MLSLELANGRTNITFNSPLKDMIPADVMAEFNAMQEDVKTGKIKVKLPQ